MVVRPARKDELEAVGRLILAAFQEHLPGPDAAISPELAAAAARYRADLVDVRSRLAIGRLLVAEDEGALVGSVTLQRPGAVPPWPVGCASVRLLAVEPRLRGRGIGRVLTEACVALARGDGAAAIGLHTSSQMAVARAMYARMGFTRAPQLDEWPAPEVHAEAWVLRLGA